MVPRYVLKHIAMHAHAQASLQIARHRKGYTRQECVRPLGAQAFYKRSRPVSRKGTLHVRFRLLDPLPLGRYLKMNNFFLKRAKLRYVRPILTHALLNQGLNFLSTERERTVAHRVGLV